MHIGDVIDNHALSRHISEPDADNSLVELNKAIDSLKKWVRKFPDIKICSGNHDRIIPRQIKTLGIPDIYLKSINEILELPDTWNFKNHHIISNVWYEHGIGSSGMYGAKNTCLKYGMSYVQGHTHANGGTFYMSSPVRDMFAMNVGCGCDTDHLQMRYGKIFKAKPTLGCGIVINGQYGIFVPMSNKLDIQE